MGESKRSRSRNTDLRFCLTASNIKMPGPLSRPAQLNGLFVKRSNTAFMFGMGMSVVGTVIYYVGHIRRCINQQATWEATQTPETIEREYQRKKEFGVFQRVNPSWMSLDKILTDEQKIEIMDQFEEKAQELKEESKDLRANMIRMIEDSDLPDHVKELRIQNMNQPIPHEKLVQLASSLKANSVYLKDRPDQTEEKILEALETAEEDRAAGN